MQCTLSGSLAQSSMIVDMFDRARSTFFTQRSIFFLVMMMCAYVSSPSADSKCSFLRIINFLSHKCNRERLLLTTNSCSYCPAGLARGPWPSSALKTRAHAYADSWVDVDRTISCKNGRAGQKLVLIPRRDIVSQASGVTHYMVLLQSES